jgi:anti-sigma28 factor (negative regulator of flagellin synthesis)
MKIDGMQRPMQSANVYKSFMENSASSRSKDIKAENVSTDRVEISSESFGLNEARSLARKAGIAKELESSSQHSENFETVRNLVEQGKYSVSSEDVAKSIIKGKSIKA